MSNENTTQQLDERIHILEHALFESNEGINTTKTIVSPTWLQTVSPGATHSSLNAVFRSILPENEVEKQVKEVIQLYRLLGVKFRWYITPLTQPSNTEEILIKNGFSLYTNAEGLIIETDKLLRANSPDIEVHEIKMDKLDDYVHASYVAWGEREPMDTIRKFVKDAIEKKPYFHPFVAYINGSPVGAANLISISSGAYLAAGSVVPEYRNRGVYRALITARAKLAEQLGHKHTMIHARKESSAPICRKLGFEWVFDYKVYEF